MGIHVYAILQEGHFIYMGVKAVVSPYPPKPNRDPKLFCAGMPGFFGGNTYKKTHDQTLANEICEESQGVFYAEAEVIKTYITGGGVNPIVRTVGDDTFIFYVIPIDKNGTSPVLWRFDLTGKLDGLDYIRYSDLVQFDGKELIFPKFLDPEQLSYGKPGELEYGFILRLDAEFMKAKNIDVKLLVEHLMSNGICKDLPIAPPRPAVKTIEEFLGSETADVLGSIIQQFGT